MRTLLALMLLAPVLLAAQLTVSLVDFEGNKRFSDRELLRVVKTQPDTPLDPQTVQSDPQRIVEHYAAHGRYNVQALTPRIEPNGREARVTFVVEELEPVRIDSVSITGARAISERRLRELLRVDNVRTFDETGALVEAIPRLYADNGWLFAACTLDSIGHSDDQMTAWLRIEEGPACRPRNWRFEGAETTRHETILKISQADRVDMLTTPILLQIEENLRRKEYIRDAVVIPINGDTALLRIEEDRMTHISAVLGYSNDDNGDNTLTGWVNVAFLNLFGTDRALEIDWARATADRSAIEMKYHESGPLRWPVAGDLTLYREEIDSTYIHTTVEVEAYYYTLTQRFGVSAGVDDYLPGSRRPKLIEKASYKSFGAFWSYHGEDYQRNPRRGDAAEVRGKWIVNNEAGETKSKTATEFDLAHYQSLWGSWVMALALHGRGYDTHDIEDYERYEMGGAASLRGFIENRFAGSRLGWADVEMRYLLGRNSRAFLFFDYGAVEWSDEGEMTRLKDLIGVGFGLRVMTRVGQFQLDYAVGKDNAGWGDPADGIVHFGIETRL